MNKTTATDLLTATMLAILTLLPAAGLALFTGDAHASTPSAQWELKGVSLNMPAAQAKELFPAATCQNMAPGVELCEDVNAQFAGGTARVVLKFLDGRLISIVANDLDRNQAESAAQGLTTKFGAANTTTAQNRYVQQLDRRVTANAYVWRDGDATITVLPFERGRVGGKEFYAQVTLSLIGLHDTVWLPRARGEAVMTASADI